MPRKQTRTPSETAAATLEQADRAITEVRANLADIRHQQRTTTIEARDLEEQVRAELVAAGREGRDPRHVTEWRSRLADTTSVTRSRTGRCGPVSRSRH